MISPHVSEVSRISLLYAISSKQGPVVEQPTEITLTKNMPFRMGKFDMAGFLLSENLLVNAFCDILFNCMHMSHIN